MSSMEKKNTKRKEKKKPSLNPLLPHDLLLSCLARVSRLYYPTLSLVSKHFRSLLTSPELYKARSLLNNTESCLYVWFKVNSELRLFTLCRRPNIQTLTSSHIQSGYVLAKVSIPRTPFSNSSTLVAVSSNIYKIGESNLPNVSIFDCKSHTWRKGPNLREKLTSVTASVLDQKIYVAGCGESLEKNFFDVLDTTTETWDPEPIPCRVAEESFLLCKSTFVNGKFYVNSVKEDVVYSPKEGRWDMDMYEAKLVGYYLKFSCCEIGNVLYCLWNRSLTWYDTEERCWVYLLGLRKFRQNARVKFNDYKLADYGGKMAVLWKERYYNSTLCTGQMIICCSVIALERRKRSEIWGKVEWCGHVVTVPKTYDLVKVLSATV